MDHPHHALWPAARDLCLPSDQGVSFVTSWPARWDELLDTPLPLLISNQGGSWPMLASALWESGLPAGRAMRLVEEDGRVREVRCHDGALSPEPETERWVLSLGWTHPDEGWRARRPLWGRHYVVTRAEGQGRGLVEQLESLGATVTHLPTIAFVEPDDLTLWRRAVAELESFHWIVFTSPNGVRYFMARLSESERDLRSLGRVRLACIGPSTARTLAEFGLKADLVPSEYVAEGLLEALEQGGAAGGKILLPRAQVARTTLPEGLQKMGCEVLVAPVYKTVKPATGEVALPKEARLLFTSSSTVKNWVELSSRPSEYPCLCIGPITAATARDEGLTVEGVARVYTIDGLLEEILRRR